jgi:DNA-binding NtrC family response regulator
LPPLRDRLDDLENLITYFVRRFNRKMNRHIQGFSGEAVDILRRYRWPGNIRELENIIERAFIIENGSIVAPAALPDALKAAAKSEVEFDLPGSYAGPLDFDSFKEQTEKEFIVQALKANHGRINQTVAQAGIPKNTLLRKIKKYSINVKELAE